MLTSRSIDDLATPAKNRALKFLAETKAAGIDVIVTSTLRDHATQDLLYACGRTRAQLDAVGLAHVHPAPGPIVTNWKGGDSFHQYGCAFDIIPIRDGKPVWGAAGIYGELCSRLGAIGEACGLEWGGHMSGEFCELMHFQFRGGLTLANFKAGLTLANFMAGKPLVNGAVA